MQICGAFGERWRYFWRESDNDRMWSRSEGEWFDNSDFGNIQTGDEFMFFRNKFKAKEINY